MAHIKENHGTLYETILKTERRLEELWLAMREGKNTFDQCGYLLKRGERIGNLERLVNRRPGAGLSGTGGRLSERHVTEPMPVGSVKDTVELHNILFENRHLPRWDKQVLIKSMAKEVGGSGYRPLSCPVDGTEQGKTDPGSILSDG